MNILVFKYFKLSKGVKFQYAIIGGWLLGHRGVTTRGLESSEYR